MKTLSVVICLAILFILSIKPSEATRILHDEREDWIKKQYLVLQSLEMRKDGTPSPNPCSNLPPPKGGGGHCATSTISERSFAGHVVMAPSPPPPPAEATRILHDEQEDWMDEQYHVLQSLQRVPSPNPCTNIPKGGGGHCVTGTISERSFAGHAVVAPPPPPPPPHAYFEKMVQFDVATDRK